MRHDWISKLREHAAERQYDEGALLRLQGGFAPEMLLLLEGEGEIDLTTPNGPDVKLTVGRNSLIGEIGFLTGGAAIAHVRALTNIRALAINHTVLRSFETQAPVEAAEFCRHLARTAESRLVQNRVLLGELSESQASGLRIQLCNTPERLVGAQRMRYEVYCGEFNRPSPYADHEKKTIVDDLDVKGTSFIALVDDRIIGTARVNFSRDGHLGILPEIYGMAKSPMHPEHTCVITKYAINADYRGGVTYMKIFAAMATFITQTDTKEIFIDCVPPLARFYATMGFEQCEENFMHYENGLSVPMKLDIPKYFERMPLEKRHQTGKWR